MSLGFFRADRSGCIFSLLLLTRLSGLARVVSIWLLNAIVVLVGLPRLSELPLRDDPVDDPRELCPSIVFINDLTDTMF